MQAVIARRARQACCDAQFLWRIIGLGISGTLLPRVLSTTLWTCAARYERHIRNIARTCNLPIHLFVGSCVLSRADSLVRANDGASEQAQTICELFTAQARRRMARNVRGMARNEGAKVEALAAAMLAGEKYPWDVICGANLRP